MNTLNEALVAALWGVEERARQLRELVTSGKGLPVLALCRLSIAAVEAEGTFGRALADLSAAARDAGGVNGCECLGNQIPCP